MSCQQVSRFITNSSLAASLATSATTTTPEDPYVFTETVPTTPPILFNTQKSRSRLVETHLAAARTQAAAAAVAATTATAAPSSAPPTTKTNSQPTQKLPLTPLNGNLTKAQASSAAANGTTTAAATTATSVTNCKNVSQQQSPKQQRQQHQQLETHELKSQKKQQKQQQQYIKQLLQQQQQQHLLQELKSQQKQQQLQQQQQQFKRISTNVCIVRPQQHQQQQLQQKQQRQQQQLKQVKQLKQPQQQQQQHKQLQKQQPQQKVNHQKQQQQQQQQYNPSTCFVAGAESDAELLPPPPPPLLLQHTPSLWQTQLLLDTAATPTPTPTPTSVAAPNTSTSLPSPATGTHAMAMVLPLVATSAAPLPPSNFHSTTLAQHLQKVQCLKKPKKANASSGPKPSAQQSLPLYAANEQTQPPPLQAFKATTALAPAPTRQHSDSDLNEIPVNVIFRKPQTGSELSRTLLAGANCGGGSLSGSVVPFDEKRAAAAKDAQAFAGATAPPAVPSAATTSKQFPAHPPPTAQQMQQTPSHVEIVFVEQQQQPPQLKLKASSAPLQIASPPPFKPHDLSSMGGFAEPTALSLSPIPQSPDSSAPSTPPSKSSPTRTGTADATASTIVKAPAKRKASPKKKNKCKESATFSTPASSSSAIAVDCNWNRCGSTSSRGVAIVKMSPAAVDADTSLLACDAILPYCMQQHWLSVYDEMSATRAPPTCVSVLGPNIGREDRIGLHKRLLQRRAMQLLTTRSLQKAPLRATRRRLLCVDRLLRKYEQQQHQPTHSQDNSPAKQCVVAKCTNRVLAMASHCAQHIVGNAAQHIFLPCTAKFADNTQCRIPVFDIAHDLPLCAEHARKRDAYNRSASEQRPRKLTTAVAAAAKTTPLPLYEMYRQRQQLVVAKPVSAAQRHGIIHTRKVNVIVKTTQPRKRKAPAAVCATGAQARPQKRNKKASPITTQICMQQEMNQEAHASSANVSLPPLSAVLQRKSSITSLESLASNSHSSTSSCSSQSALAQLQSQPGFMATSLAPPALAPLSGVGFALAANSISPSGIQTQKPMQQPIQQQHSTQTQQQHPTQPQQQPSQQRLVNFGGYAAAAPAVIASDLKEHEINKIVAQFAMAAHNNNLNSNSNNHNNNNSNNLNNFNNSFNTIYNNNSHNYITSNNNNNNFNNFMHTTNTDSNFTSALGSSSSLPSSGDDLLTQDMLSICENSSAYASSEDTGLGGLSESDLMVGPHDADEIPLGDTRLLEEQDLDNVLSTLPGDAFDEIFNAVRQDERDEVERALELADKHLISLQQTIGVDSDFLGNLLDDVSDALLCDADICGKMEIDSSVLHSPDTSALFIDGGSNSVCGVAGIDVMGSAAGLGGGNGIGIGGVGCVTSSNSGNNALDIRGLVQT